MAFNKPCFTTLVCCLALTGCNDNGSDNVPEKHAATKQLQAIDTFQYNSSSKQLEQRRHVTVSYKNGRIQQFSLYNEAGIDKLWATSDDPVQSYIRCVFSGKLSSGVRDMALEFKNHDSNSTGSVSGDILLAVLGIELQRQSYCALDYQNDAILTEKEAIPKLMDTSNPDQSYFTYQWKALTNAEGERTGSQSLFDVSSSAVFDTPIDNCVNLICDQTMPFYQKRTFNYAGQDLLVDPQSKTIRQYIRQDNQLKTVKIFGYSGEVDQALTNISQLPQLGSADYYYTGNQTRICSKATGPSNSTGVDNLLLDPYSGMGGGAAGTQIVEKYDHQQITQRDYLNTGADGKICTVDDIIYKTEKYLYQ